MSMTRCRPNDLAEVIGAGPDAANLIGARIVVTECHPDPLGVLCWQYVAMDGKRLVAMSGRVISMCEDSLLKPIRPEGEEDEMLRIAGKRTPAEHIAALRSAMARPRIDLTEVPQQ
jgi:hypothetical protein